MKKYMGERRRDRRPFPYPKGIREPFTKGGVRNRDGRRGR
jgi:hypothetical protein